LSKYLLAIASDPLLCPGEETLVVMKTTGAESYATESIQRVVATITGAQAIAARRIGADTSHTTAATSLGSVPRGRSTDAAQRSQTTLRAPDLFEK